MGFGLCRGNCTVGGTHCEGCGRSHADLDEYRRLIDEVVSFARRVEVEDNELFADFVRKSVAKRLNKRV
eukprot:g60624.t1